MLPGKKYRPEDILLVLWRYRWFLLVPFATVSAGTAIYARTLPNLYLSEATVMVVPQRVPESYVRSTVTTDIEDRLRAIREQVMSRTRLERVIVDLDLYREERRAGIMQDIVERMRGDIRVTPGQGETFRVGFVAGEPSVARQVAERITTLFIDESLRQRESLADNTSQFLDAEVEAARQRLAEHEKRVEAFRVQYSQELPEQQEANLQAAARAQMQIQQVADALSSNRQRRLALERQLADLESQAYVPVAPTTTPTDPAAMTLTQQLAAAKAELERQLKVRTDAHPDVVAVRRVVQDLERRAEEEALRSPLSDPNAGLPPAEVARQKKIAELRVEVENVDREIEAQIQQDKDLRAFIAERQRRAEMAPRRQSETIELTRDYGIFNKQYADLLAKREDAQIAANLERRQIGEQFTILDAARQPERPFEPNRERINLMGLGAGLSVGLALVALLEYRDRSFRSDDEVRSVLALPVFAVVPVMQSRREKRRARQRAVFLNIFVGSTVLAGLAVVAYTWIR